MKIAISSKGTQESSLVDPRFGRCGHFAFHDTENASWSYAANAAEGQGGGAGVVAVQQLIDAGVDVILTGSLGPNAYEAVSRAGLRAYKVSGVSLTRAVELLQLGELEAIDVAGPSHSLMHKTT